MFLRYKALNAPRSSEECRLIRNTGKYSPNTWKMISIGCKNRSDEWCRCENPETPAIISEEKGLTEHLELEGAKNW